MTTTTAVAHRRVCKYCQITHEFGAVCPCGSIDVYQIEGTLWYCNEHREFFALMPNAPETNGMCPEAFRRWSPAAGPLKVAALSCGGADVEYDQATSPLPAERDGNAFRGLAVAILIMASAAIWSWGLLHAYLLWKGGAL
jgi:hypothetical protein